jgi:Tfp pilus assembly protein FimT
LSDNTKDKKKNEKRNKRKINWSEYNESLVRRGEVMFDTDFLANWRAELKKMNKGKEGAKYLYPNSLILLLATVHVYLLPYRQLEGFLRMMSIHIERLQEAVPDYTTMWWRVVVKVKVHLNPKINLEKDVITIAVDSTGIKVTNRGEWIREKWNNNDDNNNNNNDKKRRGFIKIHVAVNVRTKKILSMEVTKEDVYDGKMLKKLVDNVVVVSENNDVKKILADGAYDSNDNFRYIDKMKIEPVIRVRKNSSTKARVCSMSRKMVVIEQLRDMKRWKKKHGYGMRWIAESAFSSIKRTFGEYVSSVKWNNIVNELLLLKASIYNMFVDKTAV